MEESKVIMKENRMETSKLDELLPRYYKGFDMDILIQKMYIKEPLTEEESQAIDEAQKIYYEKHFEENKARWEKWKKEHPGEYRTRVDRSMFKSRWQI